MAEWGFQIGSVWSQIASYMHPTMSGLLRREVGVTRRTPVSGFDFNPLSNVFFSCAYRSLLGNSRNKQITVQQNWQGTFLNLAIPDIVTYRNLTFAIINFKGDLSFALHPGKIRSLYWGMKYWGDASAKDVGLWRNTITETLPFIQWSSENQILN